MKILVIDNYDSFTFNLVQTVGKLNCEIIVKRNDELTLNEIYYLSPNKILISPGPGKPEDSKISLEIIQSLYTKIPILGVCLGHQAIGISFGAKVIKSKEVVHGKTTEIIHDGKTIFKDIPQNFKAMRYHSLIIDKKTFPSELEISAKSKNGIIMGVRHKEFPLEGIQFHPESVLTTYGEQLIKNWINL